SLGPSIAASARSAYSSSVRARASLTHSESCRLLLTGCHSSMRPPSGQPLLWHGRGALLPALAEIDEIDDPCERVEAENRERYPGPVMTPCEKPGEQCVDHAEDDDGSNGGVQQEAEANPGDERLYAKEIAPPEGPVGRVAPPVATIQSQCHDDGNDG